MIRLIFSITLAILFPTLAFVGVFYDGLPKREGVDIRPKERKEEPKDGILVPVPSSSIEPDKKPDFSIITSSLDSWQKLLEEYYTEPARLPNSSYLASNAPFFLQGVHAPAFFPIRNWDVVIKEVDAAGALALEMPQAKVLYQKNIDSVRSIASLTKLMTALVAVDTLSLTEEVFITPNVVETLGEAGGFFVDEMLTVEQLLYALLLDSSNDAAVALEEAFALRRTEVDATLVRSMNEKAEELGMTDSSFVEPTGLLPENMASSVDVATLLYAAYQNDTLRTIMGTSVYETESSSGILHRWVNRNTLLDLIPGVVAGKTGYTEEAGESMAVITKITDNRYLITVILGSTDRTNATNDLIQWVKEAYVWE